MKSAVLGLSSPKLSSEHTFARKAATMTTTTFTSGNMVTTVVDLTSGLGVRTTEEILALTGDGAVKEYSETLPDGRIITYSLEVEEEVLEEEEDIEIVSSKRVTTLTLNDTTGIVESAKNTVEGEEITVKKTNSRTVSREEGSMVEIIRSEEREGGETVSMEYHKGDDIEDRENSAKNGSKEKLHQEGYKVNQENDLQKNDEETKIEEKKDPVTVVSANGVLVTNL